MINEIQNIFSSKQLREMKDGLRDTDGIKFYLEKQFNLDGAELLSSSSRVPGSEVVPILPTFLSKGKGFADLEYKNAKVIFEAYKHLSREDASDERFWAYLTHTTYWNYMKKRTDVAKSKNKEKYILDHWFVNPLSPSTLVRNDVSRLWWGAYLTHDDELEDPYILTKELFSMQDYTRTIMTSMQGRNRNVLHGVLSFVIDNPEMFSSRKEAKIRLMMRKINQIGGYRLLSSVSKDDVSKILSSMKHEIDSV